MEIPKFKVNWKRQISDRYYEAGVTFVETGASSILLLKDILGKLGVIWNLCEGIPIKIAEKMDKETIDILKVVEKESGRKLFMDEAKERPKLKRRVLSVTHD